VDAVRRLFAGYAGEKQPLAAYAATAGLFGGLFALAVLAAKRSGRSLLPRLGPGDLLLLGMATYRLSRLIARDRVTSFLRAPFVELVGPAGAQGEVVERPRGTGLQLELGQLLTSPNSVGQWVAAGFAYGLLLAPEATRLLARIMAVALVADFVGRAWRAAGKESG